MNRPTLLTLAALLSFSAASGLAHAQAYDEPPAPLESNGPDNDAGPGQHGYYAPPDPQRMDDYRQRQEDYRNAQDSYHQQQEDYQQAQQRYQGQSDAYRDRREAYYRANGRYWRERSDYDGRYGDGAFERYYRRHPSDYDAHYGAGAYQRDFGDPDW